MRGALGRSSLKTAVMLGLRVMTQAGTLVLLTRLLGPSQYGNYTAVAALAVVLGTLPSLGSGYVLLARGSKDAQATADIWRYTWPLTLVLGLALLGLYLAFAPALVPPNSLSMTMLFWIGASELILAPYSLLFSFALQSQERVPLSQLVQWIPLALRLLAAAMCFSFEESARLSTFVALQFIAALIGVATSWLIARRHVRFHWRPRLASAQELRTGSTYALMFLVTSNPSELDKMAAARLVGPFEAGIYASSSRAMSAMVMPVVAMLLAAQPRLFRHAHDPNTQNRALIRTIALLAGGWGLFSSVLLMLCAPLLPRFFGHEYEAAAALAYWLALIPAPLSLRVAAGSVLVALGRPLERVGFELGGLVFLLLGMLAMGRHFGPQGLIAAVTISEILMCSFGWWLVMKRAHPR